MPNSIRNSSGSFHEEDDPDRFKVHKSQKNFEQACDHCCSRRPLYIVLIRWFKQVVLMPDIQLKQPQKRDGVEKSKVKIIFFDLDGTLHDFKYGSFKAISAVYQRISKEYGLEESELKKAYAGIITEIEKEGFVKSDWTSREYRGYRFKKLLAKFNKTNDAFVEELVDIYSQVITSEARVFDDVIEVLSTLRQRYVLWLVTEGPLDAQRAAIDTIHIGEFFEKIVVSSEIGKNKSTGELFAYARELSGYDAPDIRVVGDSYKRDVLGAKKAGLSAILIDREGKQLREERDKITSLPVIRSLRELESAIN